ncbi:MAG: proteobacterial dedicated sortase system response regulator [Pseudomonadales bacterium]|nr:proteobacterial dedicated sortase system response regulator [Pseudomonadales bacterium]
MKKNIAIVEDEPTLRANYADAFTKSGYVVSTYSNRSDALEAFERALPDLALIDVGLGDEIEGGFDLCRQLRTLSDTLPIIFLTARDNEFDQISGLRLGADDYLTKEISWPHLLARVVALFRRTAAYHQPQEQTDSVLQRGRLKINVDKIAVYWNDAPIELTVTEFWIVHALAKYPGHVKNRTQLMDAANTVLDDSTITSHIKRLRRKFMQVDPAFSAIQTAYGMGYRWDANES